MPATPKNCSFSTGEAGGDTAPELLYNCASGVPHSRGCATPATACPAALPTFMQRVRGHIYASDLPPSLRRTATHVVTQRMHAATTHGVSDSALVGTYL